MKSPARKADHNRKPAYLDEADAPRILIVEDDSNYALKMLAWLDDWEMPLFSGACRVRVAQNIAEASEYLGRDEIDIFIVDLIISDSEDTRLASDEIGK